MSCYQHQGNCHASAEVQLPSRCALTSLTCTCACPCPCLQRQFLQTTASHRFFDIRIQSSWGSGPNSSATAEASSSSRWFSARDSDSPSGQDQIADGSFSSTQSRFANLFSNNRESSTNGSSNGSSPYSSGSSASSSSQGSLAAGTAAPWVAAALVPTIVWCLTW